MEQLSNIDISKVPAMTVNPKIQRPTEDDIARFEHKMVEQGYLDIDKESHKKLAEYRKKIRDYRIEVEE